MVLYVYLVARHSMGLRTKTEVAQGFSEEILELYLDLKLYRSFLVTG